MTFELNCKLFSPTSYLNKTKEKQDHNSTHRFLPIPNIYCYNPSASDLARNH